MGFPEAEVFETRESGYNSPVIFAGFVGAGQVGPLAAGQIVKEMRMEEVGYMRSGHLPPSTVFQSGRLRHPFRFYATEDGSACSIVCEAPLRADGLYTVASAILDWAESKGAGEFVILDGVASDSHDGRAYCAAEEDLCRVMADRDIEMIPKGFITGMPGGILNECLMRKIRGIALLAKAHKDRADPAAARTLIDAINRFYETGMGTDDLRREEERIEEFREVSAKYAEHRQEFSGMYM